jgi:hypothetical protein
MFCQLAPNERNSRAGLPRDKSPRNTPRGSGSAVGNEDFPAALKHLFLVVALAACSGADPTGDEASSESATAASAVVAAGDRGGGCDAGVAPEREAPDTGTAPGAPDARTRTRASCTAQLTRRGDPLTVEYQIK